jgi:hypothetical protein
MSVLFTLYEDEGRVSPSHRLTMFELKLLIQAAESQESVRHSLACFDLCPGSTEDSLCEGGQLRSLYTSRTKIPTCSRIRQTERNAWLGVIL